MSYRIVPTPEFIRRVKKLSKTYRNIHRDLEQLTKQLQSNLRSGTDLGHGCYKIRLVNSSIPTGKRGGFRAITYYVDTEGVIRLLFIYSKRDQENISDKQLQEIIERNLSDRDTGAQS
jgi:mRNA-degrading endonuclease RelE of RelBE toxin-antitoxin system